MESSENLAPDAVVTQKKTKVSVSEEFLKLFLQQKLEVAGDFYVKPSRFQKSRKYHVELREATIVVYRNAEVARSAELNINDVVLVFSVPRYSFDVVQRDSEYARVFVSWTPKRSDTMMYIKVMGGQGELDTWRYGLARAKVCPLPSLKDLTIESVIGRGGGGKVFMVSWQHGKSRSTFALKAIEKIEVFKSGKSFRHAASERLLMERVTQHPFLLRMLFAFQTQKNLFIGTQFCSGGDLASYLRSKGDKAFPCHAVEMESLCLQDQRKRRVYGRLSESQTRMIAAEIILGLEHLHGQGIVYRDLKPENVFIDQTGHLKLGDYGLAKLLSVIGPAQEFHRATSVCGTRNYLPPEMLWGRKYSYEADVWSLGVMLYRILCGALPFEAKKSRDLFHKVKVVDPLLPSWLSPRSSQLLGQLLEKDPNKRLSISNIKRQPFFESVNWEDVLHRRVGPCIPDFELSSNSSFNPLDNFELSKLEGITIGEYDVGCEGELNEYLNQLPTHEQDMNNLMIGFEYCCPIVTEDEVAPLQITKRSGGIFSTLTSIDKVALFRKRSWKKTASVYPRRCQGSFGSSRFQKLGFIDLKSPRGIQPQDVNN